MYKPVSSVRKRMILKHHENKEARYKALGDEFYYELLHKRKAKKTGQRKRSKR